MIQVPKHNQQEMLQRGVNSIFLYDPLLRKAFLDRFSRDIRPIRTTAHAIAEIHGLAKAKSRLALRSQHLGMFWRHSFDFLLAKDLEESLVRLIALKDQSDVVCEIGPSDTAIIHLAHKMGGVLLTTDSRLVGNSTSTSCWRMSSRTALLYLVDWLSLTGDERTGGQRRRMKWPMTKTSELKLPNPR